jgi:RNA polymerase sigma factor FliA
MSEKRSPTPNLKAAARRREDLILAHIPMVKYQAYRIVSQGPPNVDINDLINAGVLGLMDSIEKFDSSRGVKFTTYAELRIRGAILDSLRKLDWVPRSLRVKNRALSLASRNLQQRYGREVSTTELCAEMGMELAELYKLNDDLKASSSCDSSRRCDGDASGADSLANCYPDGISDGPYSSLEKEELKGILLEAVQGRSRKERLVVSLYYFDDLSMKEIGAVLRVSESRVSQLHTKAMMRLRVKLKDSSYRPK